MATFNVTISFTNPAPVVYHLRGLNGYGEPNLVAEGEGRNFSKSEAEQLWKRLKRDGYIVDVVATAKKEA